MFSLVLLLDFAQACLYIHCTIRILLSVVSRFVVQRILPLWTSCVVVNRTPGLQRTHIWHIKTTPQVLLPPLVTKLTDKSPLLCFLIPRLTVMSFFGPRKIWNKAWPEDNHLLTRIMKRLPMTTPMVKTRTRHPRPRTTRTETSGCLPYKLQVLDWFFFLHILCLYLLSYLVFRKGLAKPYCHRSFDQWRLILARRIFFFGAH
mmetsp:Transcript_15756/g.30451  ORF Transcript_15756/g.30451 Transcript_15756/m.30451 type:complete len:203 (-) Transcript_15756:265-873(-)